MLEHPKHRQPHLLLINLLRIDTSDEENIAEFGLAPDRVFL